MNDMGRSPRYASAGDCGLPVLGGARPDFSVRSRDLFPLPVPPRLESTSGLSRRSSQRLCRKVRKMDTVREAVHGLNWLAGRVFLHDSETPPDDLQGEVLQRIHLLAQDSGTPGDWPRQFERSTRWRRDQSPCRCARTPGFTAFHLVSKTLLWTRQTS